MNGIHFKSPWAKPFDPQDTRRTNFHLNSFSKVKVDMMTKEDQYAHGDLPELNAHAVVLPYEVLIKLNGKRNRSYKPAAGFCYFPGKPFQHARLCTKSKGRTG